MKVWTISSVKGYISGVYFDRELALKSLGSSDLLEEWEPEITYDAGVIIKELAQELT